MRKKSEPPSAEEILKDKLDRVLYNIDFCPEPSYFFSIGDNVSIGNLENCVIRESLYGGKVYLVEHSYTDNNYGNKIRHDHCFNYWLWYDVRPVQPDESHGFIKNGDLRLSFTNSQIESVLHSAYVFGLDDSPEYQRGYEWCLEDKQLLIQTIFEGGDIGKFVFVKNEYYDRADHKSYEVIDGKQRINALREFYENKFAYRGCFYNQLSKREQEHFESHQLSVAYLTRATREQKLRCFISLNRRGKPMSEAILTRAETMLQEETGEA